MGFEADHAGSVDHDAADIPAADRLVINERRRRFYC
jgi:hypothetical protein